MQALGLSFDRNPGGADSERPHEQADGEHDAPAIRRIS
jgi:hypothetical protein